MKKIQIITKSETEKRATFGALMAIGYAFHRGLSDESIDPAYPNKVYPGWPVVVIDGGKQSLAVRQSPAAEHETLTLGDVIARGVAPQWEAREKTIAGLRVTVRPDITDFGCQSFATAELRSALDSAADINPFHWKLLSTEAKEYRVRQCLAVTQNFGPPLVLFPGDIVTLQKELNRAAEFAK